MRMGSRTLTRKNTSWTKMGVYSHYFPCSTQITGRWAYYSSQKCVQTMTFIFYTSRLEEKKNMLKI